MGQVRDNRQAEQQSKEEFRHLRDGMSSSVPNALTRRVMEESEKGINLSRTFDSIEELMEELNR